MIWGLAIEPGQMYSCTLEEEVHLSLAALESRPESDEKASKYSQVVLKTKDTQQLLCTLVHGTIFQQSLDLKLMPRENVSFSVQGSGVVYITGYSYSSPVEEGEEESGEFNTSQDLQEEAEVELQEDEERYEDEEISMDIHIKGEPVNTHQDEMYEKGEHSIPDVGRKIEQNASVSENRLMEVPAPDEATQLETTHTVAAIDNLEEPNLPQTSDSGWLNEPSYPPQVEVSERTAERMTSHDPSPAANERSFTEAPGTSRWINSRMTSYPQQGEQVYSQPARNPGGHRTMAIPRGGGAKHQSRHRGASVTMANRRLPDSPRTLQSSPQQGHISNLRRVGVSGGSKTNQNSSVSARSSFRCQICHAIFQSMAQVKSHEKTHSAAKHFMCRFCGKILVGSRLRHERIHTGEKPYQCNICFKSFNDRSNMKRHTRMVHMDLT